LVTQAGPAVIREHLGGSAFNLSELGLDSTLTIYAGFLAVAVNLVVAALATLALRAARASDGTDSTAPHDYVVDRGDPEVHERTELVNPVH
jgi:solute:Na+ symporter, SSS family